MRGTRETGRGVDVKDRIIPAHAGNSGSTSVSPTVTTDHPRACGELVAIAVTGVVFFGSSPRMRGTRRLADRVVAIPPDHPRACGELEL